MPISSVMVSLDGSAFAETALPVAARLARMAGARLRLVMAHAPAYVLAPAEIPAVSGVDDEASRAEQLAYLAASAREFGPIGGRQIEVSLIEGMAGPVLIEETDRELPDFLVMATHGRGPLTRLWLGSVADHVLRHASVPILLIRPREQPGGPVADATFRNCLVPLDRSPDAEAILEPLVDLARLNNTHLTLLTVIEPVLGVAGGLPPIPLALPDDALEGLRVEARKYLEQQVDRLRSEGVAASIKVVAGIGLAATILAELEEGGHDFVAMSTHGAGGFRRLLLGSVADKVIRGASKPVLVVRPSED